jgi:hypothetical protein
MFACNVPEIDKGIKTWCGNNPNYRDLPRLSAINAVTDVLCWLMKQKISLWPIPYSLDDLNHSNLFSFLI